MKTIALTLLIAALTIDAQTLPQMTVPKVKHKKTQQVVEEEEITHSCPAGYEAHYVDVRQGFDFDYYLNNPGLPFQSEFSENVPAYTLCFSKEFMDEVRKNPDLKSHRPSPPRAI